MDDLLDGMMRLMNHDSFTGPVNIGNPGEFTILELAKKVIQKTGSKSTIIHKELPADDPLQRKPDITSAKKELNWEPKINLDEGLDKTITYFRNLLGRSWRLRYAGSSKVYYVNRGIPDPPKIFLTTRSIPY